MKFTRCLSLFGLIAISSKVSADLGRKLGQTRSMLAIKLGLSEADAKQLLKGYGCFCYTQGQTSVGPAHNFHGQPLDELDQLCKKLYKAEKCINIDSTNGMYPKGCDIMQGTRFTDNGLGDVTCDDDQNKCKIAMCEIENDFSSKVAALVNSGFVLNPANLIDWNDEAGYRARCPAPGINNGSGPADMECCGQGLARTMYNPLITDCCDGKTASPGSC